MDRAISRTRAGVAVLALVAAALTGCSSQQPTTGETTDQAPSEFCPTSETTGTIKISMSSPLAVFAPLLLGIETGAFEEAGIDIQIERISSAQSLPMVAQGQLDAQITSLSAFHFNAIQSGVELKWIAPMDLQQELPPGTPVPGYWSRVDVVGPADNLDLMALKGATVSSPTGGTGVGGKILDDALKRFGLTINDVNMTSLVGPDALVALENGAVDAAWIAAPLEVEAAKNPELVPIAGYAPGVTGTSIIAGRSLLDRPQLLVRFLQVLSDVTAKYLEGDYRANPETVKLLASAQETEERIVRESALLDFDPTFSMEGTAEFAEELQAFLMERGELEYDEPISGTEVIDTRYTEALASCARPE
jgi:ABC-type nitrate/sulfonate/bicarbonate transport system substrate-binding protein